MKQPDAFLQKLESTIKDHLEKDSFSVHDLSKQMGLSRMQLHRKIKSATNQSTTHYIRAQRLDNAKSFLEETDLSISEIAYEVGFSDPAFFSRCFHELFGESPSEYRNTFK